MISRFFEMVLAKAEISQSPGRGKERRHMKNTDSRESASGVIQMHSKL